MILMLHVFIALLGIVVATAAYLRPTTGKINAAYGLVAATLASGAYLVAATSASAMHMCVTGVAYLVGVGALALAARAKLAQQESGL